MALRWIGGMIAGIILVVGAAAAGWFVAHEEVEKLVKSLPNATPEKKQVVVEKTKAEQARAYMDQNKYKEAVMLLAAETGPADVAARGEARWFDYVQKQAEKSAPLDKDADEVKKAVSDLKGKNDLFVAQIDATINAQAARSRPNFEISQSARAMPPPECSR